jgi:hypothetical protein
MEGALERERSGWRNTHCGTYLQFTSQSERCTLEEK